MPEGTSSKTELLERRAERELVREGKTVLEERRDLLAHFMLDQIRHTEQLVKERDRMFDQARQHLHRASMRHGLIGVGRFAIAETNLQRPQWQIENRLGTSWLVGAAVVPKQPPRELGDGVEVSLESDMTVSAFQQLLIKLLELAEAENNLVRLTDAFRRTQRRVNALDHIVLPEITEAIRRMEETMDEMERDDLVRSLLIKRKQAASPS
jgi:V/A-type H+-transporting ATPase subunit D